MVSWTVIKTCHFVSHRQHTWLEQKDFVKKMSMTFLKNTVDENEIDASNIYNVDKTGVSTVQNKCQKVVAEKGKRSVGPIASGEREESIPLLYDVLVRRACMYYR